MNPELSDKGLASLIEQLQVKLTMEDYRTAVIELYRLAKQDTSGSRAAAQVLLSAYNGYNWQLDVTDLVFLDRYYREQALILMECRSLFSEEPHRLIKDGSDRFMALQHRWRKLHINNRWKSECSDCLGLGFCYPDEDKDDTETCDTCKGRGQVADIREFP